MRFSVFHHRAPDGYFYKIQHGVVYISADGKSWEPLRELVEERLLRQRLTGERLGLRRRR